MDNADFGLVIGLTVGFGLGVLFMAVKDLI